MAAPVPFSIRSGLEDTYSGDVMLHAIKIESDLIEGGSLCLIGDSVPYTYNGLTWNPIADLITKVTWMSDGDGPPRAKIEIQNVDQEIGDTVQALTDSPIISMFLWYSTDFDLTVIPRVPIGTPQVYRLAEHLKLSNVRCDVFSLSADLSSFDYTRAIAGYRAIPSLTPGMYL
ncbi:MAG: hypothetical protein ACAH27_05700 [Xanthobacteraceae bacterium]